VSDAVFNGFGLSRAAECRPYRRVIPGVSSSVIPGLSRNPKMTNKGTWILGQAQNDKIMTFSGDLTRLWYAPE
jgi:hypothetical protein